MLPLALLSWLSPVFPTGGFAYSGGLETAVREGRLATLTDLVERIRLIVGGGTLWTDGVLVACAFRAAGNHEMLVRLAATAKAFAGSDERLRETCDQGRAFLEAARPWGEPVALPADTPLPVRLGAQTERCGFRLPDTLSVFLHGAVSAQLQAAIRLSLIGQTGAASALAALEPDVSETVTRLHRADLADLGTSCLAAEIDALRHADLDGRLFLS